MNAAQLLALYDRVAEAPDAVARLRRFVLDLAVRGKLVEQDPADEPASELLKRIAAEKARLGIKETITSSTGAEASFELPLGWTWTTIGEVCSKTGSGSTPRGGREVYKTAGVAFLRSQNVHDDGLRMYDVAYIEPSVHARMRGTQVMAGDLLLNITGGSIGRCCRVPDDFEEANVSQHVAIIRPSLKGMADFLHLLALSPYFQAFVLNEQTGAGRGGLPKNRMDRIAVALPPLAEQRRIVAKVAELMKLCDRLESARTAREGMRNRLTLASLARLTAPDTDAEVLRARARFALDTLPALTTRQDQIRTLRETILDLAVCGKLVEQDPAEEPASELLGSLTVWKAEQLRERSIRADRPLPPVSEEDEPFSIPSKWEWVRAQDISLKVSDGVHQKPHYVADGVPFLTVKNLTEGAGISFRETKFISKSDHREFIKRTHPEMGDVLVTKDGTIGVTRVIETEREFSIFVSVALVKMVDHRIAPFLALCLNSPIIQHEIVPKGAALKHLHLVDLRRLPLPLPPLAEQNRIIAKVDSLMAVCNRLEAALTVADATRTRLLEALLHEVLAPAAGREMEAAE